MLMVPGTLEHARSIWPPSSARTVRGVSIAMVLEVRVAVRAAPRGTRKASPNLALLLRWATAAPCL